MERIVPLRSWVQMSPRLYSTSARSRRASDSSAFNVCRRAREEAASAWSAGASLRSPSRGALSGMVLQAETMAGPSVIPMRSRGQFYAVEPSPRCRTASPIPDSSGKRSRQRRRKSADDRSCKISRPDELQSDASGYSTRNSQEGGARTSRPAAEAPALIPRCGRRRDGHRGYDTECETWASSGIG